MVERVALAALSGDPPELPPVEPSAERPTLGDDPAVLLGKARATTWWQRCLVVALWLEEVRGQRSWRPGELGLHLRRSFPAPPKNVSDLLRKGPLAQGLVQRDEGGWSLTDAGRELVLLRLLPLGG